MSVDREQNPHFEALMDAQMAAIHPAASDFDEELCDLCHQPECGGPIPGESACYPAPADGEVEPVARLREIWEYVNECVAHDGLRRDEADEIMRLADPWVRPTEGESEPVESDAEPEQWPLRKDFTSADTGETE